MNLQASIEASEENKESLLKLSTLTKTLPSRHQKVSPGGT